MSCVYPQVRYFFVMIFSRKARIRYLHLACTYCTYLPTPVVVVVVVIVIVVNRLFYYY